MQSYKSKIIKGIYSILIQDDKMTCDDLAKKCKAGDKKACELYKEKCGKVILIY